MNAKRRGARKQFAAALRQHHRGRLIEAERLCQEACAADPDNAPYVHFLGVLAHRLGRGNAAELIARAIALRPQFAEAHNDLGVVLASQGRLAEAGIHFERATILNPRHAEAHGNLGNALRQQGKLAEAQAHFERSAELDPSARAHIHLGNLRASQGRMEEAMTHYLRAVEIDGGDGVAHYHLANAMKGVGRMEDALAHYRLAVARVPELAEAHNNLGSLLRELGELDEAVRCCRRAVALRPTFAGAHNNLGNALRELGKLPEALGHYARAVALDPTLAIAHYNLGVALRHQTRLTEACQAFERAVAIAPGYLEAKLALCMAQLPAIYANAADIARQRAAYAQHLRELDQAVGEEPAARLAEAVGWHQPFYLPYQGCNDRELQGVYGKLVCRIVQSRSSPPRSAPLRAADEPVRVGIVSGFFRQHSNWKIPIKGWLTQLDRRRFRVFGYHTGCEQDEVTKMAAELCERFIQGPLSAARWCEAIVGDSPHVLIYPEVGMDPMAARLAAQRLAPVQCNSWGHPVTSGLPTLDYFLSSELMEPDDAQSHYTERLIRLPNLSVYYEPVASAPIALDRPSLGLREDATVYWCSQSLPKYLPQFDCLFPRIAQAAGDCQFVFIAFAGAQHVNDAFRARLERAFAAFGLRAGEHILVLPRLDPDHYQAAIGQCDVVLDSVGWSGCNSTLESLAHNLPIVTLAGTMMRGRHSAAILRAMEMGELIAAGIDDYVAAAVRLARDPSLRRTIAGRIAASKHRAYRDSSAIAALESFLEGVTPS